MKIKKSALIFSISIALNTTLIIIGLGLNLYLASIIMFAASILIHATLFIWFSQQEEIKLNAKNKWYALPLAIIFISVAAQIKDILIQTNNQNEKINEIGQLLLSRYQLAVWVTGFIFIIIFVVTSSVLSKER